VHSNARIYPLTAGESEFPCGERLRTSEIGGIFHIWAFPSPDPVVIKSNEIVNKEIKKIKMPSIKRLFGNFGNFTILLVFAKI